MPRLIFSRKIAELYHAYVFINVDIMLRDTNHDARSNIRMRSGKGKTRKRKNGNGKTETEKRKKG